MKKLALALLVIPSIICEANNSDDFEKAIKDSDIEKVQTLLPKLNNSEIIPLLDLSQQIINQRKSNLECFKMNPTLPLEALPQKSNFRRNIEQIIDHSFEITPIITALLNLVISIAKSKDNFKSYLFEAQKLSISVLLLTLCFKKMINNKRKESYTKLEKLYDNAIQIRMLLLENYNNTQKCVLYN